MRKALLFAALLAVPACALAPTLPPPAAIADRTQLDERMARGAELGYAAWRVAMEARVDAGKLTGQAAARVAALDLRLYDATRAVRAAYRAGNATSYAVAADQADTALRAALAALTEK